MKIPSPRLSFIAIGWAASFAGAAAQPINLDEAKVPKYTLPDPLVFENGTAVKSAQDWPKRRAEILSLFEKHVYGRTPDVARQAKLKTELIQTIPDFLDGKAVLKEIRLTLPAPDGGDDVVMLLMLVTPKSAQNPVPAFVGLNFPGNQSVHPDPRITPSPSSDAKTVRGSASSRWPLDKIIDRGFAVATMRYGDIDPDFDDGFINGIHGVFGKPGPEEWGSIGAWAWGLSRILDCLEADPSIDAKHVAVIGHSRLGKTALWAGAQDPRFAMAVSNNSGCGGAALSRRAFGETVERINAVFPHWFCDRFTDYNQKEDQCPVDQHQLIALMAPRPVYVASAADDAWADPKGEFLSAKLAGPVYELLGKKGVGVEEQPKLNHPVGDSVGYHIRSGKHDINDYDWRQYLDFAARHFGRH